MVRIITSRRFLTDSITAPTMVFKPETNFLTLFFNQIFWQYYNLRTLISSSFYYICKITGKISLSKILQQKLGIKHTK